jgi:hypothetical protein
MSTRRTPSSPATTPVLFLAQLSTGSFDFHAIGTSEAKAREAMRQTWLRHRSQFPEATPWSEWEDSVNVWPITPDVPGTRDYSPIR